MREAILTPQLHFLSLGKTYILVITAEFQNLTLDSSEGIRWVVFNLVVEVFLRGVFVEAKYLWALLIQLYMWWCWKLR